jgi:anti-sigma28 factor (negative regulator of flagellin synthesis)
MQRHGPDPLAGPLRGTSAWWHSRPDPTSKKPAEESEKPKNDAPPPEPAKRTRRPRKIRAELVARVKKEIADGTYETDEKFHAALDRMLETMGGG